MLFIRDRDLAGTMIDKASALCVLGDVHYRDLVIEQLKGKCIILILHPLLLLSINLLYLDQGWLSKSALWDSHVLRLHCHIPVSLGSWAKVA